MSGRRHSGDGEIRQITKLLDVDKLWDMGYKGAFSLFELSYFLNEKNFGIPYDLLVKV